jgi:hypothetical protein
MSASTDQPVDPLDREDEPMTDIQDEVELASRLLLEELRGAGLDEEEDEELAAILAASAATAEHEHEPTSRTITSVSIEVRLAGIEADEAQTLIEDLFHQGPLRDTIRGALPSGAAFDGYTIYGATSRTDPT